MSKEEKEKTSGFPLIGDQFPELEVNTTHGNLRLPTSTRVAGSCSSPTPEILPRSVPPNSMPSKRDTGSSKNSILNS